MSVSPVDPYIIYGFWAFISLLLVVMLVVSFRNTRDLHRLLGEVRGIHTRLDETNRLITETNRLLDETNRIISRTNRRIEKVNADQHDDASGEVILTPEQVAAD